ncbi:hypothetical protein Tco_1342781 [Tanacetum coccineum]
MATMAKNKEIRSQGRKRERYRHLVRSRVEEIGTSNKKKAGRKSITKAKEAARRIGVVGLGENKKGVSVIHKEEARANKEIYRFGCIKDDDVERNRCILNMERVKEVGELIGVSWKATEEEVNKKMRD